MFSANSYESVAITLFLHCNVDKFFLEYDNEHVRDFKRLHFIKN